MVRKSGLTASGLVNFSIRFFTSPLSFLFSVIVVKVLSNLPNGILVFGSWQLIYVTVTSYFVIVADLLSILTSRYAAEGRSVGGILILNLGIGGIATGIYYALVPFLVAKSGYDQPFYFYWGSLLVFSYYLWRSVNSISTGRTPIHVGIGTGIFQAVRLIALVPLLFYLHTSILGVILAYTIGYLAQSFYNLQFIRTSLKVDLRLALVSLKKSLVFVSNYLQVLIEGAIVLGATVIAGNSSIVSFYESAFTIASLVTWASTSSTGLVLKLQEDRSGRVVETSIKLYTFFAWLMMTALVVDGVPLLHYLRAEYSQAVYGLYILALSFLLRGFYWIFYSTIAVTDPTLSPEGSGEIRGPTASLVVRNVLISMLGTSFSLLSFYLLHHTFGYSILTTILSVGLLINSLGMLTSSYLKVREGIHFSFPWKEVLLSSASLVIASPLALLRIRGRLEDVIMLGALSSLTFIVSSYVINPYARNLITAVIREGINALKRTRSPGPRA